MQVTDDCGPAERRGSIAMNEKPAVAFALLDGVAENGERSRAAFVISGDEREARNLT